MWIKPQSPVNFLQKPIIKNKKKSLKRNPGLAGASHKILPLVCCRGTAIACLVQIGQYSVLWLMAPLSCIVNKRLYTELMSDHSDREMATRNVMTDVLKIGSPDIFGCVFSPSWKPTNHLRPSLFNQSSLKPFLTPPSSPPSPFLPSLRKSL